MLLQRNTQSMTGLMVRYNFFLLFAEDSVLFLLKRKDHLNGFEQVSLADKLPPGFHCRQCRLINNVGKICPHSSGGCKSKLLKINRFIHLNILCMYL